MGLTKQQRDSYLAEIRRLDPAGAVVRHDDASGLLIYDPAIRTDEWLQRTDNDEELVRATALCLLRASGYPLSSFYIERHYKHGHPSSKRDEVDLLILDADDLPFAMWEFKAPGDFEPNAEEYIRYQLFGTAPLVGAPKLLAYATVYPPDAAPAALTIRCIDAIAFPAYETWVADGRPSVDTFPASYEDPHHRPYIRGGTPDLRPDRSQADFRAIAIALHAEFFGEHPDNILFSNLLKCLLAKIFDERVTKTDDPYGFQVFLQRGKEEPAGVVFKRINDLYRKAYKRFISNDSEDELNSNEFSPERVKTVVKLLQSTALVRASGARADIIGSFFEEILRDGFKQDKGMYFTHTNLVYFMVAALDLDGLTAQTWSRATHPDNRFPYVIDPSCGSGAFLLRAMDAMTSAVVARKSLLVADNDAEDYFDSRLSSANPNQWAEQFLYGLDPKFLMAITAKVNMVLHGDGSAHVFKHDGLGPFGAYSDPKLRAAGDAHRSVPLQRYNAPLCESFDVVVSNPPFGITLASDTKVAIPTNFTLSAKAPSEQLFLERWFQLLKPLGRLGVVVPESLLNASDASDARLLLYRGFWIRAVVALPRNIFVETPTLTSILFAQKKAREEIAAWDAAWAKHETGAKTELATLRHALVELRNDGATADSFVARALVLAPFFAERTHLPARGKPPTPIALPPAASPDEAFRHFDSLARMAASGAILRNYVFGAVAAEFDYSFPTYSVDEVGYKLSKRRERPRPNHLAAFVGSRSGAPVPNLHLSDEPIEIRIDRDSPSTVLDFIAKEVTWQ